MNDKNNHNKKNIPNRFVFGIWCRETQELFIQGWMLADNWMKEDRRRTQEELDRKINVSLIENKLYEDAMSGDADKRLEALTYYREKENDLILAEIHRPVLIGDQLYSLITTILSLSIVLSGLGLSIGMFMNFTCQGSNSRFCQDVREVTNPFINYFVKE